MVLDQPANRPVACLPRPQSVARTGGYVTLAAASGGRKSLTGERRSPRLGRGAARLFKEDLMKTPLDTISGTIISGFVLTAILYFVVKALVN